MYIMFFMFLINSQLIGSQGHGLSAHHWLAVEGPAKCFDLWGAPCNWMENLRVKKAPNLSVQSGAVIVSAGVEQGRTILLGRPVTEQSRNCGR